MFQKNTRFHGTLIDVPKTEIHGQVTLEHINTVSPIVKLSMVSPHCMREGADSVLPHFFVGLIISIRFLRRCSENVVLTNVITVSLPLSHRYF